MARNRSSILEPFDEDFAQLGQILELLAEASDASTRADLAEELVREASFVEDALDRSLYPLLDEAGFAHATDRLRCSGEEVRVAMDPVYKALHHSVPMDVIQHEPRFDEEVAELCEAVQSHVTREFAEVSEIEPQISARDR